MCQSLFINTFQDKACNFIKKETLALVFSCEFCGIFRNNFFTKYFRETASVNRLQVANNEADGDDGAKFCAKINLPITDPYM